MKNIFISFITILIVFTACKDMDDLAKPYFDEGETIYLQKVDSLEAGSGRNRVKFTYLLISDPKVEQTVISYNNGESEIVVDFFKTNEIDTIEVEIGDLKEKVHVFNFKNINSDGLSSVKTEIVVPIYGDDYASSVSLLNQRKIVAIEAVFPDKALLYWGDIENDEIQSTNVSFISYSKSEEGELLTVSSSKEEEVTELSGIKFGDVILIQNMHKPAENAIDDFPAKEVEYQIPSQIFPVPGDWLFLENSSVDYSELNAGLHDISGLDTYLEPTDKTNQFKTKLGLEGGSWRLGLIINEDYTIDLYEAGHNGDWTLALEYEAAENYYDPGSKIIHLKYRFTIPGAWGGAWAETNASFKRK